MICRVFYKSFFLFWISINYKPSRSLMSSFFDSSFFISNCLSVSTLSLIRTIFPTTTNKFKTEKIKIIFGTIFCLSFDFKNASKEKISVKTTGRKAMVPKGNIVNITLKTAKTIADIIRNSLINNSILIKYLLLSIMIIDLFPQVC